MNGNNRLCSQKNYRLYTSEVSILAELWSHLDPHNLGQGKSISAYHTFRGITKRKSKVKWPTRCLSKIIEIQRLLFLGNEGVSQLTGLISPAPPIALCPFPHVCVRWGGPKNKLLSWGTDSVTLGGTARWSKLINHCNNPLGVEIRRLASTRSHNTFFYQAK